MLVIALSQKGNSLVELMISMALGFASITAMSSLVAHGVGLNNSLMAKSRLDEEINGVMAVIAQDVKRAGYSGLTAQIAVSPSSVTNPFHQSMKVTAHGAESAQSCISFAYDRNHNGLLDSKAINEEFGFRLKDNAIEIRVDGYTCADGYWQDLTDASMIKVTKVYFDVDKLTSNHISVLRIKVDIQAELVSRPEYSKHVSASYIVKNYE